MNLHPKYIFDDDGNKTSVVLPIEEFETIKNILENSDEDILDIDLKELQVKSMENTWDNEKDKAWDEL